MTRSNPRRITRLLSACLLTLTCALLILPAPAAASSDPGAGKKAAPRAQPITAKNWLKHPRIRAVRAVYRTIEAMQKEGKLQVKERKFEVCRPGVDVARRLYTDRGGKVRRYQYEGGTDDRAVTVTSYYDDKERLVFVLVAANYVSGGRASHRIYFDGAGKRIWEKVKKKGKIQGMVHSAYPAAGIVTEPRKALAEKHPCPAGK